ncbi:hypothetical protein H8356DRAFT_1661582 [Neocallimastix lanati (nom. inval.)]|nr:hypothetical protein H8356DRAFT_1661582 [Neocallimastix sp. JGI-2020a]
MKSGLGTKNRQDLEATKVKDSKARTFILTSITKEVKKEKFRNAKKTCLRYYDQIQRTL